MIRPVHALVTVLLLAPAARGVEPSFDVLVYSRTAGFRHANIPDGIAALRTLGARHGFGVEATEDAAAFTDANLARFAAVVFLSTTGDVLDESGERVFERYIRGGGGYVGIHAAADTEYDWPWYGELVGAYFAGHPPVQDATIAVIDRTHPSTAHLPRRWDRRDEWYSYDDSPRGDVHVLAMLDETTYDGGAMPADHPIAWCHLFDGGRAWYTGGGHTKASFEEPAFLAHVLGGIEWAAGRRDAQIGATIDRHYDTVVLDDLVSDPMELAVARDGRVVFVERGGVIKVWRPDTRSTVTAGFLGVFTGLEDGLLGVTLDPSFADTGRLYVYYSPAGDKAVNVLSRLTLIDDRIDPASEIVMLEVPTQRDECCHSGGSLTFAGPHLYVSTGDNTSPFASDGYTPIDERPGRGPFDAQKSSASTQDLRGKILRITPRPDGSYAIPAGNLFPADGSAGRPEIYAMGCRNPFRISVDAATGTLFWGDVGPDASAARENRGPAGHDEFNRTREPGNFGWPYFTGANKAYHDYDFQTGAAGAAFDPEAPVNDSPNNTGRRDLPPARPAWIPYVYGETPDFPALGAGGRCAMAGPLYRFDPSVDSAGRLPAYFDETLFLYEWARNRIMAVHLDEDGEILAMTPFLPTARFVRPHDLEIGPDGCLYLIEWGTGFGGGNPDARIVRIEHYASGRRPPRAVAEADRASGPVPLAVTFSAWGSRSRADRGGLTYAWDLDGDGVVDSRDAAPSFLYRRPGTHRVQLVVTDTYGLTAVDNVTICAGNTAPRVAIEWPPDGAIAEFGRSVEYRVVVTDPEDEPVDGRGVIVQPALGHDTHAHPMLEQRGDRGRFHTLLDDGHGPDADLFTVLSARYTDRGGDAAPPLSGRAEVVLQPKRRQAEHFTTSDGPRIEKAADPEGGGQVVVFSRARQSIVLTPVNLHGIHAIAARVAAGGAGGVLELRHAAPDGPLLGRLAAPTGASLVLDEGPHPIRIEFFERGGGAGLIFRIEGPGLPRQVVPASMLAHGEGQPGLEVFWYELRAADRLPDFDTLTPLSMSVASRIDFPSTGGDFADSGRSEDVAALFNGYLLIETAGAYTVSLESDDGSRLHVNDRLAVDNDGLHGMVEKSSDLRWSTIECEVVDPGESAELFVVYEPGEEDAELRLNWIEFEGPGVTATNAMPIQPRRATEGHGGDH